MPKLSKLIFALALVVLVGTAGCLSAPLGADTSTETTTDGTTAATDGKTTSDGSKTDSTTTFERDIDVRRVAPSEAPNLASELSEATDCSDAPWVSWWGTGDTDTLWQKPGELRTGWTVPGNQSTLFVAFENTTAVGADHEQYDTAVTADGAIVKVNETTGEHLYAVVVMHDVNENGEYDPGTDRPCKSSSGDGLVMTDWLLVDWGED